MTKILTDRDNHPFTTLKSASIPILLLPVVLLGCAVYTPTSNNPADLTHIESTSLVLTGLYEGTPSLGTATLKVSAVDGIPRIMAPFLNDKAIIDAGSHEITVLCEVSFGRPSQTDDASSLQGLAHFRMNFIASDSYKLVGRMAGPSIESGIKVWIEETISGSIAHPPELVYLH